MDEARLSHPLIQKAFRYICYLSSLGVILSLFLTFVRLVRFMKGSLKLSLHQVMLFLLLLHLPHLSYLIWSTLFLL